MNYYLQFCCFLLTVHYSLFTVSAATDLREAKVKEAINDVSIIPAGSQSGKSAKVNDTLKSPDIIRTGSNSRAELLASDDTVARIGANTIFSFEQTGRKINLEQGTVLFHSPKGRGGGIIQTAAATAAVTGTTIMVTSTRNGGFKVLVLEGKARVQLPNGKRLDLTAGQLSFILPGNQNFTPPITFRLGALVNGSRMVNGFREELASKSTIIKEINNQEKMLVEDTGIEIGDVATNEGVEIIDNNTRQTALGNTFNNAILSDAIINNPALDEDRIFDFSQYQGPTDLFSNVDQSGEPLIDDTAGAKVFAARNITFNTSSVNPPPSNSDGFGFYADQDITINQSITFQGNPESGILLFANNNFKATVGTISGEDLTIIARNQLDIFGTAGVPNTINVPNFTSVALAARTVILTNFDFNPSVTYSLISQTGLANSHPVGIPIIPGQTNLRDVTRGGIPASTGFNNLSGNLSIINLPNVYSLPGTF